MLVALQVAQSHRVLETWGSSEGSARESPHESDFAPGAAHPAGLT